MAGLESRDFSAPDETRSPMKTTVELVNLAGGQIGRYSFEPGWRWWECMKPVVGTESAWVVGHQPVVLVEFQGAANCAKPGG